LAKEVQMPLAPPLAILLLHVRNIINQVFYDIKFVCVHLLDNAARATNVKIIKLKMLQKYPPIN
jgi:hypothetical protein